MRRILVDHARHEGRDKRGGGSVSVPLSERIEAAPGSIDTVDAIDLDRVLKKLELLDPDQGRIVELRFFAGLTVEETAAALRISPASVKREWSLAKGWLHRELTGGAPVAQITAPESFRSSPLPGTSYRTTRIRCASLSAT